MMFRVKNTGKKNFKMQQHGKWVLRCFWLNLVKPCFIHPLNFFLKQQLKLQTQHMPIPHQATAQPRSRRNNWLKERQVCGLPETSCIKKKKGNLELIICEDQ